MSETGQTEKSLSSMDSLSSASPKETDPGFGDEILKTRLFSAQFSNLELLREFVKEAAVECGLDDSAVYAAQLAADEAATNIIEHAYGGESLEQIECKCQVKEDRLIIQLRDCGNPFEPNRIPNPDLEAELEDRDVGGLGLYFIRQLMDEVEFEFMRDPDSGKCCNILRMIKFKEA